MDASVSHSFNLFGDWAKEEENDDAEGTEVFLNEKIFAQKSVQADYRTNRLAKASEDAPKQDNDLWGKFMSLMKGDDDDDKSSAESNSSSTVDNVIKAARDFASSGTSETKTEVNFDVFRSELDAVIDQLKTNFTGIDFDKVDPISFLYYLECEDAKKTPSWKRRIHRFLPGLEMETVYGLNDALYFSELAYTDSIEDIQKGIANYMGDPYELIYTTVEGKPREPAHFLAIKKEAEEQQQQSSFLWSSDTFLEVLLVVRGTKEITDMLSDALLETAEYRDGKAHDGILKSGKWLVEKHLPLLNHLLEKSKRKKIKLTLIGHSLGAGAASIACMEFNDQPNIEATCIGFGCPALVNQSTSEKWKDKITTIVSDSDCVPRMSGATIANLLLDISECDFKDRAMDDVTHLVEFLGTKMPMIMTADNQKKQIEWCKGFLEEQVIPARDLVRREIELYPPGKCIHFYRDGVGVSAVEVPCTMFHELDITRTMVDDHLVNTGYHRMLIEVMRSHKSDSKFFFENDVMVLRAEKPEELEEEEEVEAE